MKGSLIITCHNQHRYLKQLLSLLEQYEEQLKETEIIVVDSSDETIHVPGQINYYRVPNRGPSVARNYGVEKAKGEWIVFCDADDFVHPYVFSFMDQLADRSIDAVFFRYKRAYDEEIVAAAEKHFSSFYLPAEASPVAIHDPVFFLQEFFPVHAVVFKRSVFEKIRFQEEQWFIEDVRLYLELALIPGIQLCHYKEETLASFHRDFRDRTSLSTSNNHLFWEGVSKNYSFLAEQKELSNQQKFKLMKLLVLSYHSINKELKDELVLNNKPVWNYFFGLPKLLRNELLFKMVVSVTRSGR